MKKQKKQKQFSPFDQFIEQPLTWYSKVSFLYLKEELLCEEAMLAGLIFENSSAGSATTVEGAFRFWRKGIFRKKELIVYKSLGGPGFDSIVTIFNPESWTLDFPDGRTFQLVHQPFFFRKSHWTWIEPVSNIQLIHMDDGGFWEKGKEGIRHVFIESFAKQFADALTFLILVAKFLSMESSYTGYSGGQHMPTIPVPIMWPRF